MIGLPLCFKLDSLVDEIPDLQPAFDKPISVACVISVSS